ncbi:MAG: hypothetical protein FWG65_08070 [Turicibacter sp.]|nr:hypothetical protein [Turicibacter sp.]
MDWREIVEYAERAIIAITAISAPFISFATFDYIRAKSRKTKAETTKVELEIEKLRKPIGKRRNKRNRGR